MKRARLVPALAICALASAVLCSPQASAKVSDCAAGSYAPAEQPPFGGEPSPPLERVIGPAPAGYELEPADVAAIAVANEVAKAERAEHPEAETAIFTQGPCRWQVSLLADGEEVARVAIDDRSGQVLEAWRDQQVGSELARGYEGAVAQLVNAPYVWIPLCLLFVAPFFDPRRPLRIVHLDLLVIVGLSASLYFFNRGEITASVGLTYPILGYVLLRMIWTGFRRAERRGPLVPFVALRWLVVAAVVLGAGRIALNLADSQVIDVGVAGVVGADRITDGAELYDGEFSPGLDLRGDVYGPANYAAYVPFELAWPWEGDWDGVPAAHAAAIAFDLAVVIGLVVLGLRLRAGATGRWLGGALAFAWIACPWTLYAMNANANDAFVAASVVWALVALASPAGRGVLLGLGAAAKFGTAALAPLFATAGESWRERRGIAIFSLAFGLTCLVSFAPFLPDGGLGEIYDRTIGYQADRGSPFSLWGLAPALDFLQTLARLGAVALAVGVAFLPREKSAVQVAALAAAVIVAVQLGATHWFYFYVVWFLPLYLVAAFMEVSPAFSRSGSEESRAAAS